MPYIRDFNLFVVNVSLKYKMLIINMFIFKIIMLVT